MKKSASVRGRTESLPKVRSTTVLCVRKDGKVVMAGDGQVSLGESIVKHGARAEHRWDRPARPTAGCIFTGRAGPPSLNQSGQAGIPAVHYELHDNGAM